MSNDVVNAVMSQYDRNTAKKKTNKVSDVERLKRYFSPNLGKGKDSGQKIFRILPPKAGKSPFDEVWFHELKIDDQWKKLYCPKENHTGECPLCTISHASRGSSKKEDKDIASQYSARKFYIIKGIDRDKEEDGPKFWRFRHNYKKQGPLDKLISVFSTKGDVTHVDKGRDLVIILGKDDKDYTKILSIMPEDAGPLSEDAELSAAWVADEQTWKDVYSQHSFEYLEIIAQGEVPYFSKDDNKYITKTEWESKNSTNGVSVSTMDDNGETTAVIGGGLENADADHQPLPVGDTKPPVKVPEKTTAKPAAKSTAKAPDKPVVEEADENNDDSDIDMAELPF